MMINQWMEGMMEWDTPHDLEFCTRLHRSSLKLLQRDIQVLGAVLSKPGVLLSCWLSWFRWLSWFSWFRWLSWTWNQWTPRPSEGPFFTQGSSENLGLAGDGGDETSNPSSLIIVDHRLSVYPHPRPITVCVLSPSLSWFGYSILSGHPLMFQR